MTQTEPQPAVQDFADPEFIARVLAEAGPLETAINAERVAIVPKLEYYLAAFPATELMEANALISVLWDVALIGVRRVNLADLRAAALVGTVSQLVALVKDLQTDVGDLRDRADRDGPDEDPYNLGLPTDFSAN